MVQVIPEELQEATAERDRAVRRFEVLDLTLNSLTLTLIERFEVLEVTRKALQSELDSLKVGGGSMQRALMTNLGMGGDDSGSDDSD